MIDKVAFPIAIAVLVILVKASSFLAPFNLYFSISTLVVGGSELFSKWALLVKLVIHFIVGFIVCFFPFKISQLRSVMNTQFGRLLREYVLERSVSTAQAAAFFGSLLLSWPMIVHWDTLAAFEIRDYRALFLFSYLVYFIAYGAMGGAGAKVGLILAGSDAAPKWIGTARDGLVGALAGGVATAVLAIFVGA